MEAQIIGIINFQAFSEFLISQGSKPLQVLPPLVHLGRWSKLGIKEYVVLQEFNAMVEGAHNFGQSQIAYEMPMPISTQPITASRIRRRWGILRPNEVSGLFPLTKALIHLAHVPNLDQWTHL
jgi:hypothetical protein